MLKFLATTKNAKIKTSEEPINNRGKVVEKSSRKLLFAISRHRKTRELSCLVWNRRQSDYEQRRNGLEVDQSEPSVER